MASPDVLKAFAKKLKARAKLYRESAKRISTRGMEANGYAFEEFKARAAECEAIASWARDEASRG